MCVRRVKGEESLHAHVNITQYLFVVINGKATICDIPPIYFYVYSTSVCTQTTSRRILVFFFFYKTSVSYLSNKIRV
jgi:hypothetical protein